MPDRATLTALLNALIATESRSLFRHLEEAQPYTDARTFPVWKRIQTLAHDSDAHVATLSALLDERELRYQPGSFSSDVANFHYADVRALLPELIAEKEQQIAAYEQAVQHADADVAARLEPLLAENRDQLAQLTAAARELGVSLLRIPR